MRYISVLTETILPFYDALKTDVRAFVFIILNDFLNELRFGTSELFYAFKPVHPSV